MHVKSRDGHTTNALLSTLLSCHEMSRHVTLMPRHVTSFHVMLRHVTSFHVMSCHVTSCHVMLRHVIVMPRHVTSCHVMSCHVMSCHVMPRLATSCHVLPRHVTSCRATSCHVMSRHVTSCHVMSRHVMSRRKSRDGHTTNASLSTDLFHTKLIQIRHNRVRWLSRRVPIPYRISGRLYNLVYAVMVNIYMRDIACASQRIIKSN